MFTVRIDRGRTKREVYACARYMVAYDPDGQARLTLVGMSDGLGGSHAEPVDKLVGPADCAFVMNDKGVTCDVVRAQRVPAAQTGGG
jgi:hypothetical protein